MPQLSSDTNKQVFQRIRKQFPERLTDISAKQALLKAWIKNSHLTDFDHIYNVKTVSTIIQNQKAIDSSDKDSQKEKITEKAFEKELLEAIKIIVQAYQKNESIREKYQFQHVEEMVEKTKLTLKQLLKINPNQSKAVTNIQSNSNQKNKLVQKKLEPIIQIKPQTQSSNPKPHQQTPIQPVQPVSKATFQQPKSNSLFVQKQKPISEQNIFKGQNFHRPSSRIQQLHMGQLPVGQHPQSSAESNKSKQVRVASRGIQVDKKSQQLLESKLQVNLVENTQENHPEITNQDHNEIIQKNQENLEENHEQRKQDIQLEKQQDEPELENKKVKQIVFDKSDNPFHLPVFKLSNQRYSPRKNPIQSILSNPYIKKAFTHLCKQSYIGGGETFDQIALSADIMTLNKWMVFCKQFDFVSKIKKKQLIDIFQQSTKNKPHMIQKQFLDALIIVQNKMKVDEDDFIRKHMCLDSEFAFREKVATFKVNYAGAKVNFFQQSTIKPLDKYYQNLRQKKYQTERLKQKSFILHQGKFKQDIESEILERKNQRYSKKSQILNSSLTERQNDSNDTQVQKRNQVYAINSPYLKYIQNKSKVQNNYSSVKNNYELGLSKLNISRRIQPLNYSQLFAQKNYVQNLPFTNDKSILQSDERASQKNHTELKNIKYIKHLSQRKYTEKETLKTKEAQSTKERSSTKTPLKKAQKVQQTKPQRQWVQQIKNWAQEFDKSESQESDDILREHLMNEKMKKKNLPEKMDLSRIASEFRKDEKWLQRQELQEHSVWQRETQLQATNKKQRFK